MIGRILIAASVVALWLFAVSATPGAAQSPAPPTCAGLPTIDFDPELAPGVPAFAVPPGGSCADVTRPGGEGVLELRYPDGRLWGEWRYGPIDQGVTMYLSNGTTLSVIASSRAFWAPSAVLAHGALRARLIAGPTAEGRGGGCTAAAPRVQVSTATKIRIYLAFTPARAWVAFRPRGSVRLEAGRRLVWAVPRSVPDGRLVAVGVRSADGSQSAFYTFCVHR